MIEPKNTTRVGRNTMTRAYEIPYYGHFEHPDGSWYILWVTHTRPWTARGHPWHVHATFDKSGAIKPIPESDIGSFGTYGMHNWDFETEAEAVTAFDRRFQARLEHGYELVRSLLSERELS